MMPVSITTDITEMAAPRARWLHWNASDHARMGKVAIR